jgi:tetratricopeptide (TPR) repeat protein
MPRRLRQQVPRSCTASLFERLQRGEPQFYTLSLMADVLALPAAALRHWARVGLLVPVRHAAGAAWFDYPQLVAGRHLGRFLAAGLSLREIDAAVATFTPPGGPAPLDRLVLDGRRLHLLVDGRLLGPGGQLPLPFASVDEVDRPPALLHFPGSAFPGSAAPPVDPGGTPDDDGTEIGELLTLAADLEAAGAWAEAAEALRAVLQAAGPTAEVNFSLAELLCRVGDLPAARERYYAAIEIEPDHLEARAGLGRVLGDLGEPLLALAALEGVISQEPGYPDAHFHAAGILRALGRRAEAEHRLRMFLTLAPASPWAERARGWLTGI